MRSSAGINGFGRFGQHLLKYWLEHPEAFSIQYINDSELALERVVTMLSEDQYLSSFYRSRIHIKDLKLIVLDAQGNNHVIEYTNVLDDSIPWIGEPTLFFECSGRHTNNNDAKKFLVRKTKCVIISATVKDPDKILIYGFNEHAYKTTDKIISYGSCTINAYIPFAHYINKQYGVLESDVHIIHNIPEYKLAKSKTLKRQGSTVERVAPELLSFLNKNNFIVNCTYIPYTGVSMIDYRFRLKSVPTKQSFFDDMIRATHDGTLSGLYAVDEVDRGPEKYKFTPFSAVIIKSSARLQGDNIYVQAYFDNENSATRFYDVSSYISRVLQKNA